MDIDKLMEFYNCNMGEGSDDFWLQLELLSAFYYRLILKTGNKEKFSCEFREMVEAVGTPLHNFVYKHWIETKRNIEYRTINNYDEEKIKKMVLSL